MNLFQWPPLVRLVVMQGELPERKGSDMSTFRIILDILVEGIGETASILVSPISTHFRKLHARFRIARARAKLKSILVAVRRDELVRTLDRSWSNHQDYDTMLDALVSIRSKIAIEVLAELHLRGRMNVKRRLDALLESLTDPELCNIISCAIQERTKQEHLNSVRWEREELERKNAAAKEKAYKSAIRRCPKCGENSKFRVESRDVDDGWYTHYWKVCIKCGSEIEDGNGQTVSTAREMGQGVPDPKDW